MDGIVGVHPTRWNGLPGLLCVKIQPNVDSSPLRKDVYEEIRLFSWIETLGLEDHLSKDLHLGYLPGFDDNGGMHGG
jgi:hypothetical protein